MGKKFLAVASAVGFTLALAGSAFATHTKDEANCVNTMNKDLGKMIKFKGKDFTKCVKDTSKSKVGDAQTCFDSDPKGKIAKQADKTLNKDEVKKCTDKGVLAGTVAGYTSGAIVNAAGEGAVEDLVADIFGGSMSGLISTDKVDGGCQAAVTKRLQKVVDAKVKEFTKCKKDLLKGGSDAIDTCVTPSGINADAKGKIGKAITKLGDDIGKKCPGGVATSLFPGFCDGLDGNALRDCLDELAECRVCLAINTADDLSVDCSAFSGMPCPPVDTVHKCTFDTGSQLTINTEAFPIPAFPTTGAIDIDCGDGTLDVNGKAACTCEIQAFDPVNITGIGTVCIAGQGSCPAGEVDCDGGNVLDWETDSDHNIGACTSNADCAANCAAVCAPDPVTDSGCENFCEGGANDGLACTQDTDCPDGACNGPDGGSHGNVCGCQCLSQTGAASSAGDMSCQLPTKIYVVLPSGSPCSNPATIDLPPVCIPLTTAAATGTISTANNGTGTFGNSGSGTPFTCANLFNSVTSGGKFVGVVNFFDSTLGDLSVLNEAVCQ